MMLKEHKNEENNVNTKAISNTPQSQSQSYYSNSRVIFNLRGFDNLLLGSGLLGSGLLGSGGGGSPTFVSGVIESSKKVRHVYRILAIDYKLKRWSILTLVGFD
mmetsp:Transcript_8988/g.18145  ORF Transcript_8988/g.18145 Transcript_8988/m.18145 type:complete len:104 (-) Transcript_8988:332-643(-)